MVQKWYALISNDSFKDEFWSFSGLMIGYGILSWGAKQSQPHVTRVNDKYSKYTVLLGSEVE
jgi:hypothetical protein